MQKNNEIENTRILGNLVSHVISADEVAQVSGALWHKSGSHWEVSGGGNNFYGDLVHDYIWVY